MIIRSDALWKEFNSYIYKNFCKPKTFVVVLVSILSLNSFIRYKRFQRKRKLPLTHAY